MYTIKLEEGKIIPCFRDWKNEKKFEGFAVLVRKLDSCDCFNLDNEIIYTNYKITNSFGRYIERDESNIKYLRLQDIFDNAKRQQSAVTSTTYELLKAVTEIFNVADYALYNKIYRTLYHLRKDWSTKDVIYAKNNKQYTQVLQKAFCKSDGMEILKSYDFDFLTRFFIQYLTKKQQTSKHVNENKADITEQANALFIGERWEVIFYQQKNIKGEWLVLGEFRTNRWFRKLVHPKTIQNPFSNFFELHGGHNPHDKSHLKRKDKYLI